ncbi:MAG: hypothetical protein H7329_13280 [Opitutaceae bacterium]|nr:hypothetical protein [Cytophagales bacterium]
MENKLSVPAHWDEKHIISSLYYLVADSDFVVKKEEIDTIDKKLDILLHQTYYVSTEQKYKIANEAMNFAVGLNDVEKLEVVRNLSSNVKFSHELFVQMINDMEDIAQSDDYVSIEEHSLMYYIRLKFKKDYVRAEAYC